MSLSLLVGGMNFPLPAHLLHSKETFFSPSNLGILTIISNLRWFKPCRTKFVHLTTNLAQILVRCKWVEAMPELQK